MRTKGSERNMELRESVFKSAKSLYNSLPVLAGVVLLVGLANTIIPKDFYSYVFSNLAFFDTVVAGFLGSILAGNPVTSYVLGGEFLKQGVSLYAVTAFMVAWVTVGIVQFPAESIMLGKRFAILRNATSFVLSLLVALLTVLVVGML